MTDKTRVPTRAPSQSNMALSDQAADDSLRAITRSVLFQKDVFHCILDCLAAPEASPKQFRQSRRVLVSLAQTCRAFSEPSLDRLWSKLDSLEPLIQVLTEELTKAPIV